MAPTASSTKQTDGRNLAFFFLAAVFLLVVLRSAWMDEDAYITLRTVDNFVHGYGLVWNVGDRVQTYTNPLWMFMLSIPYALTHDGFYTPLLLCVGISLAAFLLVGRLVPRQSLPTLAVLSILVFSKAFVDFSTSGLENPATHLLLAAFLVVFLADEPEAGWADRRVFVLGLIAALGIFNRMDTALIYAPALALVFVRQRSMNTVKWLAIGFLPFILWEIFSIVYYGFPFPNTAYAKLNTGAARIDLLEQGYLYLVNSLHWDPITLLTIGAAGALAALNGDWRERSLMAGVLLYLLYVVWIGGDYMSGRFLSGVVLVAVGVLVRAFAHVRASEGIFLMALVILVGFMSPTPTLTSVDDATYSTARRDPSENIDDERSFYFQNAGLLYDQPNTLAPFHEWALRGLAFRNGVRKVYINGYVGMIGYFAGPGVTFIDPYGICDALMARLPPQEQRMAGHTVRVVPKGYEESVRKKANFIKDPDLAQYYDGLSLITRGNIWSWDRFVAIWKMNTGQYDYLLQKYTKNQAAR